MMGAIETLNGNFLRTHKGGRSKPRSLPYVPLQVYLTFPPPRLSRIGDTPLLIADGQREMRLAYYGGAPGMLTSAAAWLVAGIIAYRVAPTNGIWALFIGGALIHPVSRVMSKVLGRSATHSAGNPLGALALATTVWLVVSLPLAYVVSRYHIEWFFPAMLFVIGGRYLTFATIFGTRLYWFVGATLIVAGYALGRADAPPGTSAFVGAAVEAAFAAALFTSARREPRKRDDG